MNGIKTALSLGALTAGILFAASPGGALAEEPARPQLKQGELAPAFELKAQDGKTFKNSDFKGRKLLLYFYPKAGTPGCTAQACSIRDAMPELGKLSIAAAGVSPDQPEEQAKFAEGNALAFPLLSDPGHKVAESYGAWGMRKTPSGEMKQGVIRSSFLIDEEGRIAGAWYNVKPEDTVPNAMKALK